jgi:hypothetical protein
MVTRSTTRRSKLEAVAYHEAGHAVAALELGHQIGSVSISPAAESLGRVQFKPPPEWFAPDIEINERHRLFIEEEILIDLAGDAAWRRFMGRSNRIGSRSDDHSAVDLASYLYDGDVLRTYMAYMWQRASAFVARERHWIQIEALAKALVEAKDLTEDQARDVCEGALREADKAALGTRWIAVERDVPKIDDLAVAVANLLIELFPPKNAGQQFYLVGIAEVAVAQIQRELENQTDADHAVAD